MPLHTCYNGWNPKKLTPPSADKAVKQQELSFVPGGNAKWSTHFDDSLAVSYRAKKIVLLCDPAITLLGIYPNELKIYAQQKSVYDC